MKCPHCGGEASAEAAYCSDCGNALQAKGIPNKQRVAMAKKLENRIATILVLIIIATVDAGSIYYLVKYGSDISQSPGSSLLGGMIFIALAIVNVIPILYLSDKMKKRVLKCPHCNEEIKAVGLLWMKKKVTCKCGMQLKIIPGFLRNHVSEWEPPDDSQPEQEAGNRIALILGLIILVAVNIGIINFIVILFNSERGGQATVNNLHIILIIFLAIIDSVIGLLLVRNWKKKKKKE